MRAHITRLILTALAFAAASKILNHVGVPFHVVGGWKSYAIDAVAFGILNVTMGAILRLLTLPLRILTFGLFSIVINAAIIGVLTVLPKGTYVRLSTGVKGAFVAAIIVGVFSTIADITKHRHKEYVKSLRR